MVPPKLIKILSMMRNIMICPIVKYRNDTVMQLIDKVIVVGGFIDIEMIR